MPLTPTPTPNPGPNTPGHHWVYEHRYDLEGNWIETVSTEVEDEA